MPLPELEYQDVSHPCNVTLSEYRFKGKTIAGIQAGSKKIFKEPRTPNDEPVREQPYMDLHFTDGTFVRVAACVGGLSEDFGDGPVPLLTLHFMGITEYSEPKKTPGEKAAEEKRHEESAAKLLREVDEAEARRKNPPTRLVCVVCRRRTVEMFSGSIGICPECNRLS